MIKLLIIDDFEADREELLEVISTFSDLDIFVAGTYEDGLAAVEVLDEIEPDIILCDVQMSYMDGFEVLRHVNQKHPDIKFVFCSLHSRMDYLKTALSLDCSGYILKPIDPKELHDCLENLIQKCSVIKKREEDYDELKQMVKNSLPSLTDGYIRELLYGNVTDEADARRNIAYLNCNMPYSSFGLCIVEVDDYYSSTESLDIQEKHMFTMKTFKLIDESMSTEKNTYLVRLNDTRFALVVNMLTGTDENENRLKMSSIAGVVLMAAKRNSISLTITVSDIYAMAIYLSKAYEQCQYMLRFKYNLGKSRIIMPNEISGNVGSFYTDLPALQKDIRYILNSGDREGINTFIGRLFERMDTLSEAELKNICYSILIFTQMVLNESGYSIKTVFGFDKHIWEKMIQFETILDVGNWIKNILFAVNAFLMEKVQSKVKRTVSRVKNFVEVSPLRDVSLNGIAADLFYSPNYLNTIYKRETGETISEYITSYRIEMSKKLLSNSHLTIAEIAQQLGYSCVSYFNYVFKKHVGVSPKECREKQTYDAECKENSAISQK